LSELLLSLKGYDVADAGAGDGNAWSTIMSGLGALMAGIAGGLAARRKKRAEIELECVVEAIRGVGTDIARAVRDEGDATRKLMHTQAESYGAAMNHITKEIEIVKDRVPRTAP
jgi:LPXTG-motif cell wall-anchored protein